MTSLISFGALIVITIGVVEVIKRALKLDTRYIPLVALVVGFGLNLVAGYTSFGLTVVAGLAVGLSAVGLFDQKKILGK